MPRMTLNSLKVLFFTALVAATVFFSVEVGSIVTGTTTTTANSTSVASGTLVCPRTGCTASTCHAAR